MMQFICFDAYIPGNHEFNDGDSNLAGFVNAIVNDSPLCNTTKPLAANLVPGPDSSLKPLVDDGIIGKYLISEFDGEEVGVIGIAVRNKTLQASSPDPGTDFIDERETVITYVEELEGLGINKIILLTHTGYLLDQDYLSDIPGVDVIIGGDSHSLLGDPLELALIGEPNGPFPTIMQTSDSGTVCIYQVSRLRRGHFLQIGSLGTLTPSLLPSLHITGTRHFSSGTDLEMPTLSLTVMEM
jgi:5'-nucleotidase / UDP-sugar diphosphatase